MVGDAADLVAAFSGKGPVTGEKLETWERWLTAGTGLIPFVSGSMVRGGREAVEHIDEAVDVVKRLGHTDEVIEAASNSSRYIDDIVKGTDEAVNLYKRIDRSFPASYYTYSELKNLIKKAGLSGRTKGFEAHHLLEKQFADVFGVAKNDIISVPLTPKWPRNIGGMGNNLDNLISGELDSILTKANKSNVGINEIWQAHKNVYERIGQFDWANAVYEEYVKKFNIPYK